MSKGGSGGGAGGVATGGGGRTDVKKASGIRWYKDNRAIAAGDVAVKVSVAKLDAAWQKAGRGLHVGPDGGNQGKAKLDNAKDYLRTGKKAKMPEVHMDKRGGVTFRDGRHRAAAARDLGKKFIYVTVSRGQAKRVKRDLGA